MLEKIHVSQFKDYLEPRPHDFHKGDAGHVLIVGGDAGYTGAPRMAAEAALRVGCGLVSIATRKAHAVFMNMLTPEIMCHGVEDDVELTPLLNKATVVIVGPGLGKSEWAQRLLSRIMQTELPLVIDADALNLLAENPKKHSNWILTPHPGEAARLLKTTVEEIQKNRESAVKKIQHEYGGIAVLKGAGTLIAAPAVEPVMCDAGNPGMATAGMGDILSGVIGGLLAQAIPIYIAAQLGVCLHATAGDLSAEEEGQRGMMATDLIPYLRHLVNYE